MNLFSNNLNFNKENILYNIPDGVDCFAVFELLKHFNNTLVILRDDVRLERFSKSLKIIDNKINIIEFPAWDCLPFDKNSPNQKIIGRRVKALFNLLNLNNKKTIVLTTVSSLVQKIPHADYIKKSSLKIEVGKSFILRDLTNFLESNGYIRTGTVREDSEYSIKGGIVDVFQPGETLPIRIDFFGNEIDSIKSFDPINQLSIDKLNIVNFYPGNEIILNDTSVDIFRRKYREIFGANGYDNSIYQLVSEYKRVNGIEQYLSLFHEKLTSIFNYLSDFSIILDKEFDAVLESKFEDINDFYNARKEDINGNEKKYNLLPLDNLYFSKGDIKNFFDQKVIIKFDSNQSDKIDLDITANINPGVNFSTLRIKGENPIVELLSLLKIHKKIVIISNSIGGIRRISSLIKAQNGSVKLTEVLNPFNIDLDFSCAVYPLEKGFKLDDTLFVTEEDLFGLRVGRPSSKIKKAENFLRDITSLTIGDLLVHVEHGIGKYDGLETVNSGNIERDCLKIIYSGNDRLYLPVENIELVSRYGSGTNVNLDKLGSSHWQARKAIAKKRIKEIADELIKIAASRQTAKTKPLEFPSDEYNQFCSRFSFTPTEDQFCAIRDVENDLKSGKLMDRLICGDVGYGKTEIALRASFMTSMAGFQVALIAPTTLLVKQHVKNFKERFRGFPVKINELSRFIKPNQSAIVRNEIRTGETQIIIGTHSLLSKKIEFNNLSLLIIDEEQHFGVSQKEYLKSLRSSMHVLTLTATPIPRTLQMSLSGVRSMSLITTPPVDRLSIRTFVSNWDNVLIKEAIRRETHRGGLTFCVVPRIKDLDKMYKMITTLLPNIKIATAHGKMKVEEIDNSMMDFSEGKADLLLSTNIIESGLDIPSANTLIVYNSDKFGLSQLYQMRGRVGRGRVRAYAYLTTDENKLITSDARKRLEVMQTLDNLGAGFSLASYDMDIRGAGNLLGEEQSGHIKEVGIELYQSLLKNAIEIQTIGKSQDSFEWSPQIQIGISSKIPESYITDITVRLSIYRRIAFLKTEEEIDNIKFELLDRFGVLPVEVLTLLEIILIKQLCKLSNIFKIDVGNNGISLKFYKDTFSNPEKLLRYISHNANKLILKPDQSVVILKNLSNKKDRIKLVKEELIIISNLAN